uniref:Grancalcin n=1 Tax=Arundo donax TaxID=35708 RepID=A0A0A9G4D1_ARUDO
MKLSYSTALLLPPVLSNLDTSRSSTVGETE